MSSSIYAKNISFLLLLCILSCTYSNNHPFQSSNKKNPIAIDSSSKANDLFFTDSGFSSIVLKRDTVNGFPEIKETRRTQSYHFVQYAQYDFGNMAVWHALISEQSYQISMDAPTYQEKGEIILSAFIPNTNPIQNSQDLKANKWSDTIQANSVRYDEEFIESIKYREAEKPLHTLYHFWDGSRIMKFTSDFYGLEHPVDYMDRRYIGYLEKPLEGDSESSWDTISGIYGVLTYANPISNKSQHLIIKSDINAGPDDLWRYESFDKLYISGLQRSRGDHYSNHEVAFKNSEHWAYSDFKHLEIILTYSGNAKITLHIPIINDRIDISHIHSEWFEFELR